MKIVADPNSSNIFEQGNNHYNKFKFPSTLVMTIVIRVPLLFLFLQGLQKDIIYLHRR